MGRKPGPKPSKTKDAVLSLPAANALPSERVEQQASNGNINPTEVLESQLENPHPMSSPLKKHLNSSVAGVETSAVGKEPREQTTPVSKHQKKYATLAKKMSKYRNGSVRRSERIRSGVVKVKSTNSKQGVECVVDMTVSDSEKDESDAQTEQVLPQPNPTDTQTEPVQVLPQENTQAEPVQVLPQENPQTEPVQVLLRENTQNEQAEMEQLLFEPESELELNPAENASEKSVDVKVDYALQKIDALYKMIELLTAKVDGNASLYEAPSMALGYRSMYIDSQKKLEALSNENEQLKGQLEVYEKVLDKMKDVVNQQLSTVAKTTEAAVISLNEEIDNAYSASAGKRKRIEG